MEFYYTMKVICIAGLIPSAILAVILFVRLDMRAVIRFFVKHREGHSVRVFDQADKEDDETILICTETLR